MSEEKAFPIMEGAPRIFSIPLALLAPHESQAQANHGQSLSRLAERGGLAPMEALAIIEDRRFRFMDREEAIDRLVALVSDAERAKEGGDD